MWTRVNGLYKAPVVKTLLTLTAVNTFLSCFTAIQNTHPVLVRAIHTWAFPTSGAWLAGSALLYFCRSVERRLGSHKFTNFLFVAATVSLVVAAILRFLPLRTTVSLGHMVTCAVAVEHLLLVPPLNSHPYFGISITSNIVIYGLIVAIGTMSPTHMPSLVAGIIGGIVAHKSPNVLPSSITVALQVLGGGDYPTKVHSGATIEVQQQQQYDHIEQLMMSLQTLGGEGVHSNLRQRLVVPQQLVQQLVDMGFTQNDARQALLSSGGNVDAAINLLASRNH